MKDYNILVDYFDVVGKSLIDFLNTEHPPVNTKGKYTILMNSTNKRKIKFFLEEHIKSNVFFGKQTIILQSCDINKNWRKNVNIDFKLSKYKLVDNSIWIDTNACEKFFDTEYIRLKKKYKKVTFLDIDCIDTYDLKYYLKNNFLLEIYTNQLYNIIEDGNVIYERDNKYPNFISQIIELKLKENGVII